MYVPYGMIPALPTPFNEDNSIDFDGIKKLVNHLIEGGLHCLLVGGSTGEYTLMSFEERKSVIKFVCEEVNGRVPVMVGTGCHRTEDTIELTKYAAEVGAACALVLTPYYMQTTKQGIIDYYKTIAENSSIGIVLYHYPAVTNVYLDPQTIYELSQIDGIVGIKDTAEQEHTCKLIGLTKDNENFAVLTGYEHLILPTLSVGGAGAVGIVHNMVPKEIVKLYDLVVKDNNLKEATKLNQRLMPLYDIVEEEPVPAPIKAALEILGFSGGVPRLPLVPPSKELKEKLEKALKEFGYPAN